MQQHTKRVVDKICSYGADDVSVADKDEYKHQFKDIRQVYEACIEEANTLLDKFVDEESIDKPRVDEVNQLQNSLTRKMKNNEKEVRTGGLYNSTRISGPSSPLFYPERLFFWSSC